MTPQEYFPDHKEVLEAKVRGVARGAIALSSTTRRGSRQRTSQSAITGSSLGQDVRSFVAHGFAKEDLCEDLCRSAGALCSTACRGRSGALTAAGILCAFLEESHSASGGVAESLLRALHGTRSVLRA